MTYWLVVMVLCWTDWNWSQTQWITTTLVRSVRVCIQVALYVLHTFTYLYMWLPDKPTCMILEPTYYQVKNDSYLQCRGAWKTDVLSVCMFTYVLYRVIHIVSQLEMISRISRRLFKDSLLLGLLTVKLLWVHPLFQRPNWHFYSHVVWSFIQ